MDGLTQALMHDRQVRIGVTDVFVAPADTAVDATGGLWQWQGVMEAGSATYNFPYEMFELKTGHPNTTKIQAIVAVDGEMGFTLEEYHAKGVELATGGPALTKAYGTVPAPTTTDAATAWTDVRTGKLTSVAGLVVGMRIEIDTSAAKDGSRLEDVYVESVNATTKLITVKPDLSAIPQLSANVKTIYQYVKPIGGVTVVKSAVKYVFTDRNLEQAIIYCPQVSSQGGYTPNFGDAKSNAKLPVKLRAYGTEQTINGVKMPVVGWSYLRFPGVTP